MKALDTQAQVTPRLAEPHLCHHTLGLGELSVSHTAELGRGTQKLVHGFSWDFPFPFAGLSLSPSVIVNITALWVL